MQFIDLKAQYNAAQEKIDSRIKQVLAHGQYIMGPEVHELEEKLADRVGVAHVISCANGTDALQLALMALGVGPGDAVIVPTFTFFASAEAVAFVGATPVFVDVARDSFNLDVAQLESAVKYIQTNTSLTFRAIMAVDLFGQPANYNKICAFAKQHQVRVIEDAAQGFGGQYREQQAGSFGDIATTSFFPAKPLGCYGDGGAIFTNNEELAEVVKSLRVHGKGTDKYDNIRIGMNSRLDTIQAAVLLEKLALFPQELLRRNEIAARYSDNLGQHPQVITPSCPEDVTSSWAQYTIVTQPEVRSRLQGALQQQGVPTAIYYQKCMHQQGAFNHQQANKLLRYPTAEALTQSCFSLPMHPYLTDDEVDKVVDTLYSQL